ncbi:ubiquinone-dependent pyruvate dehydrogenase [Gordonia liuliyuniae]|uniref:Ubiquinone-dependent pyruvate dehydrogenase n=1 Tax=Gordonia liuliyuniae TaxID=2911517 RepID=A0ABS9IV31_9ACTN|nr:ubiquinone-dependent pyruvate dehydrogenase [Gordonia liuliyuniae]MCF8589424.1 ubiquinone-dependent pyruvate dehydrogenase [Gordonia liuliyuniae]
MSYTVADLIVETIEAAGVQRVYGIPGDSLNGFTDSLREHPRVGWQHVRHEEAAAFAASAEAAMTDSLAVCAGSCGPGNLHLINGLYDAHRSRVPVLAIAAQVPGAVVGTGYFQETHPESIFAECSAYCETVNTVDQLPYVLDIAIRTAVEQRGVSVLVIPGELFLTEFERPDRVARIRAAQSVVRPSEESLAIAAAQLNECDRVTILAGAGVQGAHDELVAFADALQAPIVHALRGKEFVEYDNPYDVGMTGLLGFSSGYRAVEHCDTLVMVGTDFPYSQFLPSDAYVMQLDIRGNQIGRRTRVDLPLVGSAHDTLPALTALINPDRDGKHASKSLEHYRRTRASLDDLATPSDPGDPVHPQYLTKLVSDAADADAVFVPDVGSPVVWASRYLEMNGRRRLIGSFSHGSMANALSQAIGVASACPDRQVVALAGDGGLSMLFGELLTLVQAKLPVKVVVYNNSSLNFVELEMKAAGFLTFGTDLENPDFARVADAIGVRGFRAIDSQDLAQTVEDFLAYDGPALLDVRTARQELSIPPSISAAQAKGFALYALRTVMSGRGDELLDLAETNLLKRLF